MSTTRLHLTDISHASSDRLTDELAAAGQDSTVRPVRELRADVATMLHEMFGPFDLCDENNNVIREATLGETVESALAGPEGWILVDGRRCYVAE